MNTFPKISVLIPVYNVERHIEECLNSVINQTYNNIEIICVNDCSTDNSYTILQKYAETDSRITIINKENNEGLLMARKSAVKAATGEYIVFVDSDDYIDENLCKFAVETVNNEKFDIIHYSIGAEIAYSDVDCSEFINSFAPYEGSLNNYGIMEAAYKTRKYATSLVGKIFKADLCKKVYDILPDEHCYVGEDVFTYFFLAMFAQKYAGIKTPYLYNYRYGLGVSGLSKISISKFEMFCKMSKWIKFTKSYLEKYGYNKIIYECYESMKLRLFNDCCEIFRLRIKTEDKTDALLLIYKYWGNIEIDDSLWLKNTGEKKSYIKSQFDNKEYIKKAKAYKDNSPQVAVVLNVHNDEIILKEKIDKLLCQTLKETEFVIVNCGSNDNSLKIIEDASLKDERITIINQINRNKGYLRDSAIDNTSAKYIYFADVKIDLDNNFLEELYDIAEADDADIVYFNSKINFDSILSEEETLGVFVKKGFFKNNISYQFINRRLIENTKYRFNKDINCCDEQFAAFMLVNAEHVKVVENIHLQFQDSNSPIFANDSTGFCESFKLYTILSSSAVISQEYSDTDKAVLSEIAKKYYNAACNIYMSLSAEEINVVNSELETEYKPFLFSIRELGKIKNSMEYKVCNTALSVPKKIIGLIKK